MFADTPRRWKRRFAGSPPCNKLHCSPWHQIPSSQWVMIWLELSARNQWFLALGNTIEKATKFRYTVLNHLMMPQNVCSWKRAKWCGRGFSWHFFQRIMTEHPWFLQYRTNTDGELPFSTASSSDESRLRSSASDPNCIILADLDNIEATATALWLLLVWWDMMDLFPYSYKYGSPDMFFQQQSWSGIGDAWPYCFAGA